MSDERDAQGRTHYDRAREYYKTHAVPDYDVTRFYDAKKDELTPLFYKGDRSMRESGFDPSGRFGPFSVDIVNHAPVCLNSLLYVMEEDAARIARELGRTDAKEWTSRASRRRAAVDRYLWDEKAGLYLDYDFETGKRRQYLFATTFYPHWAGLACPAQARRVLANLCSFEATGGQLPSAQETGNQWDAPSRLGAARSSRWNALRTAQAGGGGTAWPASSSARSSRSSEEHGKILRSTDVRRREPDVSADFFGYTSNEVGSRWTNAAVLELLAGLARPAPPAVKH